MLKSKGAICRGHISQSTGCETYGVCGEHHVDDDDAGFVDF